MLHDIEPSRRITGGAWYSEQEFDSEFIEMLQKQAYLFIATKVLFSFSFSCHLLTCGFVSLQSYPKGTDDGIFPGEYAGYASVEDVHAYILKTGVSKVPLQVDEIGSILETLVFDGKIEVRGGRYKSVRSRSVKNPMAEIPCGSCPVRPLKIYFFF